MFDFCIKTLTVFLFYKAVTSIDFELIQQALLK